MRRGILLGNGINSRIGIKGFSQEEIKNRFVDNIKKYKAIFEAIFEIPFCENEIVDMLVNSDNSGIETLAGIVYKYVYEQFANDWCVNEDIWLQDLLTCIAITTIFLDENGKRQVRFREKNLPNFSVYDFIFTLNYYEFWDVKHIVKSLHGSIDLDMINDGTNMLVSRPRMEYEKYKEVVDKISNVYNVQIIDLEDIIFAPSEILKEHLICVDGLYPSENLFPSEDLFLIDKKILYEELKDIDELDVLGMSPYGDDSLIKIIDTREKVRVFVYNKDTNNESKKWEEILTGNYELIDSELI